MLLDPFCFLVYMNGASQHVKHGILLQFADADDTAVVCSGWDYSTVHKHIMELGFKIIVTLG